MAFFARGQAARDEEALEAVVGAGVSLHEGEGTDLGAMGGGLAGPQVDHPVEKGTGGTPRGTGGTAAVLFSLGLCFHFGRGVPQDLTSARRMYALFLRRGDLAASAATSAAASSAARPDRRPGGGGGGGGLGGGGGGQVDREATHREWRQLAARLGRQCGAMADRQEALYARAVTLLEG